MTTKTLLPAVFVITLIGCSTSPMIDAPSRNQNSRVNYLVIHFTTENFGDSLALLTEPSDNPVSAHYLVPEPDDDTYPSETLRVYQLVEESRRAWHAGESYWNGEEALNDRSIGIELVNRSYCVDEADQHGDSDENEMFCFYPDFADAQIGLLTELATDILERHPEIDPVDVVGHADIAPDRKVDPGPRFPWQLLHRSGIGAWYDDKTVLRYRRRFRAARPPTVAVQQALRAYGYRIEPSGVNDLQSRQAVRAFQMHFRPSVVTGIVDIETAAIVFALIEKYRSELLADLLEFEVDSPSEPGDVSDRSDRGATDR